MYLKEVGVSPFLVKMFPMFLLTVLNQHDSHTLSVRMYMVYFTHE